MAKPRKHHNGPEISEGKGDRAAKSGGERAVVETEKEERGGTQGGKSKDPPHRRSDLQ